MKIALLLVITFILLPLPVIGQSRTRLDTTVRLNLRGTVDLSLMSGKITVRGWDQPGVRILAATKNAPLRFDATANRVILRVEQAAPAGKSQSEASYDVSLPRGTRLMLQTTSGSIMATASEGEISASTVSGAIDVSGGRRQVTLESVSGPIRASQLAGDLRAQNVSGSVRAENVSGRVEAWTVTGTVRLLGLRANDVHAETVRGDILYTGRVATGASYDFESHSGTIRLTVPSSTGARFRLETVKGAVHTDFPIERSSVAGTRKAGRVEFTIGDGRAEVTARTFNGRIWIKSVADPTIPRGLSAIVQTDSFSRTQRNSAPTARKDSVPTTRKDSVPPPRRD